MRKHFVLLIAVIFIFVFSAVPAFAGTINVTSTLDNGTNCTLREAIAESNAVGAGGASLGNGCSGATAGANTINLPNGTYTVGSVLPEVTTTITIQASSGTPIVQANANFNVAAYGIFEVRTASGSLTLIGLTVRNGNSSGTGDDGGCIRASSTGSVALNNTIIERCYGASGGGIFVLSGTLSITNNSIIRLNQASDSGGGVYVQNSSLTITNSIISDNSATNAATSNIIGGGMASLSNSPVSISGSTFSNNSVSGATNSLGGGIYLTDINGVAFSLSSNVFTGNQAIGPGRGGAIYYVATAAGASLAISSSRFETNTADTVNGDVIYSGSSGSVSITGSCFTNNGDTALFDTASAGVITANGGGNPANANWWGSSWGPRIPALGATAGSFYSTGDSINGNGATAASNQLVNVGLTNAGDGDTAPTGAWLTSAPTVAGALCQTKGSASTGAGLNVTVPFQGRPVAPNARLILPLTVILKPTAGGAAVINTTLSTDQNALLPTLSAAPGSYTLWVKGSHTLAHSQIVNLALGSNNLTLSAMLLEGDASNDNSVALSDFSLLAAAFATAVGDPGYNAQADFNGDELINLTDFSLLASNFGVTGAAVP